VIREKIRATVTSAMLVMIGCAAVAPPPHPHSCTDDDDLFVLDWTGGNSALWPSYPAQYTNVQLPAMDFAKFLVSDGTTLADVDGFTEMVRTQVEVIIDATGFEVTIVTDEQKGSANNVHISQVTSVENSEKRVGLGYYDPCNCGHSDYSLVYAQPMADRSTSLEGWTNVFANICAHEIAHNLGFDHINRDDAPEDAEYTELMLSPSSWEERQLEQRVIVDQNICPSDATASTMMECLQEG